MPTATVRASESPTMRTRSRWPASAKLGQVDGLPLGGGGRRPDQPRRRPRGGGRRLGRRPRHHDGHRERRRRRRRAHTARSRPPEPALDDRPLDQVEAGGGHGHGHQRPDGEQQRPPEAGAPGVEEDEHREVPEVDAVGDRPEPHQRREWTAPGPARPTGTDTTPATTAAADHGDDEEPTPVGRGPTTPPSTPEAARTDDRPPATPTATRRRRLRRRPGLRVHAGQAPPPLDQGEHAGQRGAHQHRLGVGVGAEVDPGGVRARDGRAAPSRWPRPPRRRPPPPGARDPTARTADQVEHGQDHQRPHQVELLLHGQRPGVGEGRDGTGGGEVVAAGRRSATSWRSRRGPTGPRPVAGEHPGRLGEPDQDGHRHQHQQERRQQPAGPTQPERGQPDALAVGRTRPAAGR